MLIAVVAVGLPLRHASAQGRRAAVVVSGAALDPSTRDELRRALDDALIERGVTLVDAGEVDAARHFVLASGEPLDDASCERLRGALRVSELFHLRAERASVEGRVMAALARYREGERIARYGELDLTDGSLIALLARLGEAGPGPVEPPPDPATEPPVESPPAAVEPSSPPAAAPTNPSPERLTPERPAPPSLVSTQATSSTATLSGGPETVAASEEARAAGAGSRWASASRVVLGATAGWEGFGYGVVARGEVGLAALPGYDHGVALALETSVVLDHRGAAQAGDLWTLSVPVVVGASYRIAIERAVELSVRGGAGVAVPVTFGSDGFWSLDLSVRAVVGASLMLNLDATLPTLGFDAWFGAGESFVVTLGFAVR